MTCLSLLIYVGVMPPMIGGRAVGVDLIASLTSRRQSFSLESTFMVCEMWPQIGGAVLYTEEADSQSRCMQNVEVGGPVICRQASEKAAARSHFPCYCFYVLPEAEGAVESDSKVLRSFFRKESVCRQRLLAALDWLAYL